ncbi:MAG: hypothetical protein EOO90_13570 [Pedobacter sp.]|nr:MAG: hypothetical protein EOO90_13570 [Pedobacter sp.]
MLATFLNHQWKDFLRSRNRGGSIVSQIFLGLFILYFFLIAVVLGFGMGHFIGMVFPGKDVVTVFNGFILYYFMFDLVTRIQMQDLPTLSVVPYLHLNISKKKIVSFLNIKSLFSIFNILPLFVFVPFCIVKIMPTFGALVGICYIFSIVSLTILNNYLALYLKRKSINNIAYFGIGVITIGLLAVLDYYQIISVREASNFVFVKIANYPFLAAGFALAALAIYLFNSTFLTNNLYTEELSSKDTKKVSTDYAFLNRFGRIGELAALELKLILRHKRSRSTLMMSFIFLGYGLLFYKKELIDSNSFGMMIFAAVFITGIIILFYGQFMFAWQSTHFDGLLSAKIDLKDFIKAKLLLFTISSTVITLISTVYGFISLKLIALHFAAYLYNIGFGSVMVLYFATFNNKRLDITNGATFNWQGVGGSQLLLSLPYLAVPMLIYLPFGLMDMPFVGVTVLGVFGLIMLLMRNFWISFITKKLVEKKYIIAAGFRE